MLMKKCDLDKNKVLYNSKLNKMLCKSRINTIWNQQNVNHANK